MSEQKEMLSRGATLGVPTDSPTAGPITLTPTPGPWAVDGEGAHVARVSSAVEITAPTVSRFDRPDDGRIDADARLLAAAPDMLAALKAIVSMHCRDRESGTYQDRIGAMALARAAIAKAEGR